MRIGFNMINKHHTLPVVHTAGFPIVGGGAWEGVSPQTMIFFENSPIKPDAPPHEAHPSLKNEAPYTKDKPPHWNMKYPSMKWFLEKAQ